MQKIIVTENTLVVYKGIIERFGFIRKLIDSRDRVSNVRIASSEEIVRYYNRPEKLLRNT